MNAEDAKYYRKLFYFMSGVVVSSNIIQGVLNTILLARNESFRKQMLKDHEVYSIVTNYTNTLVELVKSENPSLLGDPRLEQPSFDIAFLNITSNEDL